MRASEKSTSGFELPVDPRIRARLAAVETQRSVNFQAHQIVADAEARANDERLAADREDERVQTAARRNRV
jgi:hypothetical protein